MLAQWRHWTTPAPLSAQPLVQRCLAPGISNTSVLVAADAQRFVVRLDGIDARHHGITRQGEWRALVAATARGLAPAPRYFNPELGALVCDYLPPDPAQPLEIPEVAKLLRAIHALPPLHHRLDLGERIARYRHSCAERAPAHWAALKPFAPRVEAALEQEHQAAGARVLCHNDLLRANRLRSGGRLWALDWEYCAMGSPWFDLAVVCCGDDLSAAQTEALLSGYLGGPAADEQRQQLARQMLLYRYLELLWYATTRPDHPGWDARLARLETASRESY